MRKSALLSLIAFGAVIGVLFAGCEDDEPTQQTQDKAKLMFMHAGTELPAIDLQLGSTAWALNRSYTDFTTYIDANAGTMDAKIVNAGTNNALATKSLTFDKDAYHTLFAVNDASGNADLVLFDDDLSAPAAGKAKVRVAHLIPDGPAVKVAVMQVGPFASGVAFKDNSQAFTEVAAGSVTLRVQRNDVNGGGGGGGGNPQTPLLEKAVLLEDGKIYTIVLRGELGDATAELILLPHTAN